MNFLNTPFIIPVVAMLIPIVAMIGGMWTQAHSRRVKADMRIAMLSRGMSVADIERLVGTNKEEERPSSVKDPMRSLSNSRRTAIFLCSIGFGLVAFGCLLT